jgi:SAM-dependent methyltransferase
LSDRCALCGSAGARPLFTAGDRLYRTTPERFQVAACSNCGMVRLSPPPADVRRYYPKLYWFAPQPNTASRLEEFYRRVVLRDHIRFVLPALDAARGPALDVGCGGGLFLRLLRARGIQALGMDFSPEAAAMAWKRNGAPAVCGLLPQAPFRRGAFGVVTMYHVLEHLADPQAYLDAAAGLLPAGGRLIVQVPNLACWQFRLFGSRWNGLDVPRHLQQFRLRDVSAMVERAGFETLRVKHFSLRDNPAGLATTLAPALDPMARRVRGAREPGAERLAKDLLYLALTAASAPFTALEAAVGRGATVMLDARRRG